VKFPPDATEVSPDGRPLIVKVYGGTPPLTVRTFDEYLPAVKFVGRFRFAFKNGVFEPEVFGGVALEAPPD